MRRATQVKQTCQTKTSISIHALLAESDPSQLKPPIQAHNFYPRSPCGERRYAFVWRCRLLDFYPRSPCGERRQVKQTCRGITSISIHALLAESDFHLRKTFHSFPLFLSTLSLRRATAELIINIRKIIDFYPRSPCGERLVHALKLANAMLFLSTLSLRRATNSLLINVVSSADFYPRSPCGERPCHKCDSQENQSISIHALLAESDPCCHCLSGRCG